MILLIRSEALAAVEDVSDMVELMMLNCFEFEVEMDDKIPSSLALDSSRDWLGGVDIVGSSDVSLDVLSEGLTPDGPIPEEMVSRDDGLLLLDAPGKDVGPSLSTED